jgi:hypothetical protein
VVDVVVTPEVGAVVGPAFEVVGGPVVDVVDVVDVVEEPCEGVMETS